MIQGPDSAGCFDASRGERLRNAAKAKFLKNIVILIAFSALAGAAVAQERRATLAGLWQGIDAVDGSLRTLSISGPDRNGQYEVNAYDTYWSICDGNRAVSTATGRISARVLRTNGIVRCADGRETAIETEFRPELFIQEGVLVEVVIGTDSRTRLFRINR